ncbi:MAG: hypothetical protein IJP90_05765, partial [Treponema sp.]|nr:hypothetical protein [Treponema sp.]
MNLSMENLTKKKEMFFIAGLFAIACLTYIWTINLPITCDGLIHMNDHTDFNLKSWIKSLYTFNGIGKDPEHSVSLVFHRPIFDEILVEIIKKITRYNINGIHIISILVHSCSVVVSYFIGKEVFRSNTKSIILAFLMNFSIVSIL